MNHEALVSALAERLDATPQEAQAAVEAFVACLGQGLVSDGEVAVLGLGAFQVQTRPARHGRNPRTGQPITIKASSTVTFRPGKALKERVASSS